MENRAKRAVGLVREGCASKAVAALTAGQLAPPSVDTLEKLKEKHPAPCVPVSGSEPLSEDPLVAAW